MRFLFWFVFFCKYYYGELSYFTDAGMNYTDEGITLLPWERGLPYCPNSTIPNSTIPNSVGTGTKAQRNTASRDKHIALYSAVTLAFLFFAVY